MDKKWELTRSEPGPGLILFQARYDWLRNPRNEKTIKAVILESPDWVNVVAVTPENKILVVKQFRFGVGRVTVEIPAGIIEKGEEPALAAARELREETGYASSNWKYLGWYEANPAFMNNVCHMWLASGVTRAHATQLDDGEEITIAELTLDEIKIEIREGRMRNSLALLALSRVFDLRDPD